MRFAERRPSRLTLTIVVAVVVATCVFVITVRSGGRSASDRDSTDRAFTPSSVTTGASAAGRTASPAAASGGASTSKSADGSDASEHAADDAARNTVQVFVDGWLETNPQRRSSLLKRSASAELAASLQLTDPAAIPRADLARLDEVGGSDTSSEFVATLDDGQQIVVTTAADPAFRLGWAVTKVDRWG